MSTSQTTLLVTVAHTYPGSTAGSVASAALSAAAALTLDQLTADHRSWWHAFYPKSFVSIPDARLQSFWWIQLYKLRSVTRAGAQSALPPRASKASGPIDQAVG